MQSDAVYVIPVTIYKLVSSLLSYSFSIPCRLAFHGGDHVCVTAIRSSPEFKNSSSHCGHLKNGSVDERSSPLWSAFSLKINQLKNKQTKQTKTVLDESRHCLKPFRAPSQQEQHQTGWWMASLVVCLNNTFSLRDNNLLKSLFRAAIEYVITDGEGYAGECCANSPSMNLLIPRSSAVCQCRAWGCMQVGAQSSPT